MTMEKVIYKGTKTTKDNYKYQNSHVWDKLKAKRTLKIWEGPYFVFVYITMLTKN